MKRNNLNLFLLLSVIIILVSCQQDDRSLASRNTGDQSTEYIKWSIRMADSEIERRGNSLMMGGSDPKAKWRYTTGLFLSSLLDLWQGTGESKYFDYVKQTIDSFIEEEGTIKTYKRDDFNLDKINSGKVLLRLYQITNHEKYKKAADILYRQLLMQPRTSEGGFWHKKRYPWQMWLDGIYMSGPFYAHYGMMFGKADAFDDVIKQIKLIDIHTRDAKTGLRYHGWDESNKQDWADPVTGCSPHFWGRALGWFSMALVDVLDYIPETHQNHSQILYILNDLLKTIKKYQDDSGLWYQIIDLNERSGNYLETSCSAMFVYATAKALNEGYIDQSFQQVALKGYHGIISKKIVADDKGISLTGICSVAGLGGDPYRDGSFQYYISEPIVANDLKGVGPFIMAGLQMEKLISDLSEQEESHSELK